MSDYIEGGFHEAIIGALAGFFLSTILAVIPELLSMPDSYVGIFQLLDVVFLIGSILVILKMETWGIGYLAGWLFGTWIMSIAGLVEEWLFTVYVVVGIIALITKILGKAKL